MPKKEHDEIHSYTTLGETECELLNNYGNNENLDVGDGRYCISNIYDIIGNFCYPMAMFSEVSASKWTFALRGSALFVRQDDKNIAVTTQHQLRQVITRNDKKELPGCIDNVCFIRDKPLDFFRPLYIGTDNKYENESEDFAIYHIPCRGINGTILSDSFFFPASPERIWPHNKIDNHLICVGFPASIKSDISEEIDFDDDGSTNTIQQNKVIVTATCSDFIEESNTIQSIDMHTRYDINPDGMSGGSVFYVGKTHEGYFLGLAGIILQSSESVKRSKTPARFLKISHIEKYFLPK